MEFKRHVQQNLIKWKENPNRKPLIIRGARQVGKTTLIKQFAKTYKNQILLNLEKPSDAHFFELYDNVQSIVEVLFLSHNISSKDKKDTLLFIDEIQESPKAIQLLRYFYEEASEINVISAGSLLEFSMKHIKSFPVGRIEYLYLYPLNFQEFLGAIKHDSALEQIQQIPLNPLAHHTILKLFNKYTIIGGMPEVVKSYINNNNLIDLPKTYESIWETYKNDVEKYASNNTQRRVIKHIISTAHLYLDQRIKFQNFGNSNYKSREVGEAIRNLDDAKIIQLIYPTTDVEFPIKPNKKKSPRLQFLDTGLVNYTLGIQTQLINVDDLSNSFKGAIIPHIITQELISLNTFSNQKPHFWVREKSQASSEVDLVYTYKNYIIPIEVKSGKTGTLKSLHQFIERTNHHFAVRVYGGEFNIEQTKTPSGEPYLLMNLPYYLGTKIPEYIAFFLINNSLK